MFPLVAAQPRELEDYLEGLGWKRKDEAIVMTSSLEELDLSGAIDQIPLKDIGRFVDASLSIHERPADMRPGFSELLNSVRPNKGMFVLEQDGRAVSICSACRTASWRACSM